MFDNRGYWRGAVEAGPELPPPIAAGTPFQTASLDPVSTGSTAANALAYAAESETPLAGARPPDGFAPAPHAGGSPGDPGLVQHRPWW